MVNLIETTPEAVERLAEVHDTVGNAPEKYIMGHPHHWKTAKTLRAMSAHIEELEAKLAKAIGALEFYNEVLIAFSSATDATADVADETLDRDGGKLARATLAEIKGETP